MIRLYPLVAAVLLLTAPETRAQSPPEQATLGSTLTVPVLADLPTGGSLYSIFDTIPAEVISEHLDTGGLFTGEMARIGSHGSSWTQTMFRVGDADVTNPYGGGTPLLVPGVYAWDRVDIRTGLMPIEVNAPGMAVTLSPRTPSTTWTRTFEFLGSGPALLARQDTTNPPAIARQRAWNNGTLFLSGPVIPNRVGLVLTGGWTNSTRLDRADPTLLDSNIASVFTHLLFTPNPNDEMHVVGWAERSSVPYANRIAYGQPLATEDASGLHTQVGWDHRVTSGASWGLFGSFGRRAQSNDLKPTSTLVVDRLRDGPIPELLNPATGAASTWSLGARIKPAPLGLNDHRHVVHGGVVLSGASATALSTFSGRIGELVGGVPARVWDYTIPAAGSDWHSTDLAVYASDTISLHPRFTLDAGLRFEAVRGSAEGSTNSITWNNWLPRGSVRWELTDYAHIATFAGFSRYGHRLLLNELATGDPAAPFANVYRWDPTGANLQRPTPGPLIARVGPGTGGNAQLAGVDPNLERPYMDEFVAGFESRPHPDAVIRLAAIARRDKQLLGVVDVGVPGSAYTTQFITDPGDDHAGGQLLPVYNRRPTTFGQDRYLLTNAPADEATFVGVEFTMQVAFRHLYFLLGATAGRSEGIAGSVGFQPLENDHGVLGDVFIDPNARTFAQGRVFTERGYTIKTAGVFTLPGDVRVGYAARYQDGQHFARLVIVDGLNQGAEAIRAFRNGVTRFTMTPTLDVRVQKAFTVGGHRWAILFDSYNVLNMEYEVEEIAVTGPASRLTSAVQPPRAIHLGLRLSF